MLQEKFHIEFLMGNASQSSLWRMISQIDGLSEWFADEVAMNDKESVYTFTWGKSESKAEIVHSKPQVSIRYRWIDDDELKLERNLIDFVRRPKFNELISELIPENKDTEETEEDIATSDENDVNESENLNISEELNQN